ncbi:diaminopimelate epimerase [Brassicibacter mesophilus]|uniref:diaminopimelate epimerase n=1 Tax=Brassicibacter mesophilus TaxID=745119 RepID=UPI003D1CD708
MLTFEKFHGTGNDFIIFNGLNGNLPEYKKLALSVCDRHFGIGADGMIVVEKSETADIKMVFYNADGTEAPMCGNGIRCFAKYVYDNKIVPKTTFTVETLGGMMKPELIINDGKVHSVKVDLGVPVFSTDSFPINTDKADFIDKEIEINKITYKISSLFVGTIHTVVRVDNLNNIKISEIGPLIENYTLFPKKTNVNFCEILDDQNIKVITWERGAGQTLACGTGAAATAIVCSMIYGTNKEVNIHVLGGKLKINQENNHIFMTGPAQLVCKGEYNWNN